MLRPSVKIRIKEIFGDRFDDSPGALAVYSYDASRRAVQPDAVVFPVTTAETSALARLSDQYNFPLVPRGAGSGMAAGATPVRGGVVVSFEKFDAIRSIDRANMIAVVEPGVVTERIRREAAKVGLFYPPDPASSAFCTIGGNAATAAGGLRAVKYGVTADYVLGLEAVLSDGRIIKTGGKTIKRSVGYDLTKLFIGSEGTLGLITSLTLKLVPLPEKRATVLAEFIDVEAAARACAKILSLNERPAAIELIDSSALDALHRAGKAPAGLRPGLAAILLIEEDGSAAGVDMRAARLVELLRESGAVKVESAGEGEASEKLWAARKAISAALYKIRPDKLNEDVTVPIAAVSELMAGAKKIADSAGIECAMFGHAGDGNVHINFMYDKSIPSETVRAQKAVGAIFELAVALGGVISGEHGIGAVKAPYLGVEMDRSTIEALRAVKRAFDPKNLLNPGKIFPVTQKVGE